jgi:T5SS/PEP-CTERM-associated repeat protein
MAAQMIPYKVIQDSYGTSVSVIPENIDYISPGSYDFNGLEQNISNKLLYAEKVQVVRDAVVSGYYHTYFGVETLTNMLHQLRGLNIDYVPVRDIIREFPVELNQNTNQLVVNNYNRHIDSAKDVIGDLIAGKFGSNNSLDIDSSIGVTSINTFIGMEQGSVSNILSVSGGGTVVHCKSIVVAGVYGSDNSIYVTNAGAIVSSEGALGYFSTASNNFAAISDADSVWSNHFGFYIGPETSGNGLLVERGGLLLSQFGELGGNIGADGNIAEISGNGSVWSNSNHLVVGAKGNDNELIITNGGCVFASYAFAGLDWFATNNSITVSGSNSCLHVGTQLAIGADGPQSKLMISDGGRVAADEVIVGMYDRSVQNNITVIDGKLNVTNAIDIRYGNVSFATGSATAGQLLIAENCTVQIGEDFDISGIGIITNAGTLILQGDAAIAGGVLYLVGNGTLQTNNGVMDIAGDYINFSIDNNVNMTNRQVRFTSGAEHILQTVSQDMGDNLFGLTDNHAFGMVGVHGTVDVVNVIYCWSLSGNGILNISDGGRFYYVDASDWSGTVNLAGDAVFQKVNIELSDISSVSPDSSTLVWPAGSGILFSVEWVDNLITGIYAPAASIRAISNSVIWSDTGSVDRLPPQQVPIRFYRLQARP